MITALAVGSYLLGSWMRAQPPPAQVLERARAGVSRNSDWQPIIRRFDNLDMALVPAGCFTMGSTAHQLTVAVESCERFFGSGKCQVDFEESETPPHQVCFDAPFWIGKTEVTNRLYGSNSSSDMQAMYRGPNWPRESVTWQEASRFCLAHHARLPTEAEWEFTARGPDGLIYPWGNEFDLERLISGRLSPANVASIQAGASWVGASDMSGGVAEWVADWYAPYSQASATNPQGPAGGQERVIRGGSWFSFAAFFVRTSHREPADPDTANNTIGFRCARNLD
jgi:formylglycine-generating enzyme required for sulfatase activity